MKGIVVHHKPTDGTPILRLEDVPDVDTFGPDEVLVDIRATVVLVMLTELLILI